MAAERLSMRMTREILCLKWRCGRSNRQIAQSCGIARSTVAECLRRAADAELTWPVPPDLDDGHLEGRLYPPPDQTATARPLPEWNEVHAELRRVTLQLL